MLDSKRHDVDRLRPELHALDPVETVRYIARKPRLTVLRIARCEQHVAPLVENAILQFRRHDREQPRGLLGQLHGNGSSRVVEAEPIGDVPRALDLLMPPQHLLRKMIERVDDKRSQHRQADRKRGDAGQPQPCGQTSNPVIEHDQ
jgi:hypothetical protein